MTVGMPGTGIGGLYYLTLALAMPVRETWRALRGGSSGSRWRLVGVQIGIALGILAALWGQAWVLGLLARWLSRISPDGSIATALRQVAPDGAWVFTHAGAAAIIVLAAILLSVHVARLVVGRPPDRARAASAAGPGAADPRAGRRAHPMPGAAIEPLPSAP